jgi:hypothetical protein
MSLFYGCILALILALPSDETNAGLAPSWFSLPIVLHLLLALGSYKKIEFSRKVSEIVFALLLLAFPVGTLMSMYIFLPATTWKSPEIEAP